MGLVKRLARSALPALSFAVGGPAQAQSVADWHAFVTEGSQRFGVPVPWIEHVMRAESGGRTMLGGRPIVSRAGAMGLMQLMPDTWREMRAALGLGSDPFDPRDNILAGTAYLRLMYDRFGYPGMFAAYNAGPGRYAAWRAGRATLPAETRAYLVAVAGDAPGAGPRARPKLFVPLAAAITPAASPSAGDRLIAPPAAVPREDRPRATTAGAVPDRLFAVLKLR